MDRAAFESAVSQLIQACEISSETEQFAGTPERVSKLWAEQFLSGYTCNPSDILAQTISADDSTDAVLIDGLHFHSLCPHHLLPYQGQAHIAYLPRKKIVGFGQLGAIVSCYTRRLTLQERATHDIAHSLMTHLDADGAGCVLVARHACLGVAHPQHSNNRIVTSSFVGAIKNDTMYANTYWERPLPLLVR